MSQTPNTPFTPSTIENSDIPWRKKVPFNLVGRGVAGVDEMAEYLEDTKVYFGLMMIEIGSGSFKRTKNVFVHFNGEKHPKPLQRAKANKKMNTAKKLFSPYHCEMTIENTTQCSIDYVFHKLGNFFVSDNVSKGTTKFEIGSLKEEYKNKMREARKKAKAEKERLERQRQKLLEQQENEKKILEEAKLKKEEEERKRKEAEEEARRKAEEEERKRKEEEERKLKEEEERKAEEERLRLEEEERKRKEKEEEERKIKEAEEAKKKKKKKKRFKKRKKDDWSDEREWTGERVVKCIHAQTSPMNWGVFKPSNSDIIPLAFGHGDLNDLRDALKPDQVQYGIMRLTFGEGRFRRSHWVFVVWSPDSMTKVDSQKLKKKRMNSRMVNISYKGFMQKLIGPYGVEVLAEDYDYVTLEDWILRVRKTVVVDGDDELMNAESFKKALEAEKAHFAEKKAKQDEARKKKEEEERKLNEANKSSSEEEVYDKEEAKKNRKKRKVKKKKGGDDDNDEEEEDDKNDEEEENKQEPEEDDTKKEEEKEEKPKETEEEKPKHVQETSMNLTVDMADNEMGGRRRSSKRKSSIDPSVLKARNVASQLCYESITLMQRPDSDLVWVLIEPRLKGQRK